MDCDIFRYSKFCSPTRYGTDLRLENALQSSVSVEPRYRRKGVREQNISPRNRRKGVREIERRVDPHSDRPATEIQIGSRLDDTLRGKVASALLKGKTFSRVVREPIVQHKYAHLANASYQFNDKRRPEYSYKKAGRYLPELRDFDIDHELSGKNSVVLRNDRTGEIHLSFRGTNPKNKGDLGTDAAIMTGAEGETKRFRDAENLFLRAKQKYTDGRFTTSGHSLGAGQSLHVAEKFDIEGHHYDPAVSWKAALRNKAKGARQMIYRTVLDPVSVFSPLARMFGNRRIQHVAMSKGNKNPHGHTEMLREPVMVEGKPLTFDNTHFGVEKVPHAVTLRNTAGHAFDLAFVGMSAADTAEKMKANQVPLMPDSESEETAFAPLPISFMREGSIEQRTIDSLAKSHLGDRWHTKADLEKHIADGRFRKMVLYDGAVIDPDASLEQALALSGGAAAWDDNPEAEDDVEGDDYFVRGGRTYFQQPQDNIQTPPRNTSRRRGVREL